MIMMIVAFIHDYYDSDVAVDDCNSASRTCEDHDVDDALEDKNIIVFMAGRRMPQLTLL